ncbi:MAG TPA: hypothetical protein VFB22_05905 [Candidatus Baltobacteraceae bacterium]|nr:hypothetical protein [Candidatus Baltobacteraceae bacterium]
MAYLLRSIPREQDIDEWLDDYFPLMLPVVGEPQQTRPGDALFVVHDDKIKGVGIIRKISRNTRKRLAFLQQGEPKHPGRYYLLYVDRLVRLRRPIPFESFVGYRYGHRLPTADWIRIWKAGARVLSPPLDDFVDSKRGIRALEERYDVEARRVKAIDIAQRRHRRTTGRRPAKKR